MRCIVVVIEEASVRRRCPVVIIKDPLGLPPLSWYLHYSSCGSDAVPFLTHSMLNILCPDGGSFPAVGFGDTSDRFIM